MSDIQEEQKRLYKRAEENDIKIIEPSEEECFVGIIKEYQRKVDELQEENNKLNNIIDELEKYLKKQMKYYKLNTDYYVEYKLTLDKLNELKGDNK